jgi:hypothetical protein
MTTDQNILLGFGLIVAAVTIATFVIPKRVGTEITPESLLTGMGLPVIWVYYNDSEVNSRMWYDFGARSSRVINIPILNMFYETIVSANKDKYRVQVITGLQGVKELLGENVPVPLLYNKRSITTPEEDWIRSAVLAKFGGLWLSSSSVCLKGFGDLPKDKIVAFGQDTDPMYGSAIPGFRALWSPQHNHPFFVEWEGRCRERLNYQIGGRQFRGDAKSDWIDLCQKYGSCEIRVKEELGRDPKTNKKIELEDLLASGTEGRIPFTIPEQAVYLVVPYEDLLDRRHFGWILRSSEEQIKSSDLVLSHILAKKNQ